jgi:signal transduction histidine kinase
MRNRPRIARPDVEKSDAKVRSGTFPVAPEAGEPPERGQDESSPGSAGFAEASELRSLQRFKDDTIATLVHELSNPLAAMMMNLDFALAQLAAAPGLAGAETGGARSALAESRLAGAKLFRAIANLLDIARSDEGRLVPKRVSVDVEALVTRVMEPYVTEAKALSVTLRSDVTLLRPIEADPDLLARALSNLVESALRQTNAGGSIVLAARPGHGLAAVLSVTGDGRSVSPDPRASVFERDARSLSRDLRSRGLYFCRVAVEAHGGSVELVCDPQVATCFRIELPA